MSDKPNKTQKLFRDYDIHFDDPFPHEEEPGKEFTPYVELEVKNDIHDASDDENQKLLQEIKGPVLPGVLTSWRRERAQRSAEEAQAELDNNSEKAKRQLFIGSAVLGNRGKISKKVPLENMSKEELALLDRLSYIESKRLKDGLIAGRYTDAMHTKHQKTTQKKTMLDRMPLKGLKKRTRLTEIQGTTTKATGKTDIKYGKSKIHYQDKVRRHDKHLDRVVRKGLLTERDIKVKKLMALQIAELDIEARQTEKNKADKRIVGIETEISAIDSSPIITAAMSKRRLELEEEKKDLEFYIKNINKPYGKRKR